MLSLISMPATNELRNLIDFIDAEGRVVVPPTYAAGSYCFEGKASVLNADGKSGLIDDAGSLVIPFEFKGLGKFKDGLCSLNGGYIDHSGRWWIKPRFGIPGPFSEGRAVVSLDGQKFGFINIAGNEAVSPEFEECRGASNGLAAVCSHQRWGFINHQGKIAIPHAFDSVRPQGFRYGLAAAQLDGKWGFIDSAGRFAIGPEYENLGHIS